MMAALFLTFLVLSCLFEQVRCFDVLPKAARLEKLAARHATTPPVVREKAGVETSQELLALLVNHVKTKGIRGKSERIEELMEELVDQNVKFDPAQCLSGPLFAVAYQSGPAPFWVRYSKLSPPKSNNIEGQQYTLRDDNGFDVINYGEFFSKAITVQARGVAYQQEGQQEDASKMNSFFDSFFSNNKRSFMLQCPVSFDVEVDKACCTIIGKSFALDITGTAAFTVLYADPNMRILTTKRSSQIEEKGFSAVQIRVDNLEQNFPILTFPL